ncbi:MAG TPA: DUF2490 domain-containing protein [Bacteroidales bacterium]
MNYRSGLLLILLLLIYKPGYTQTNGFGIWSTLGIEKRAGKWNFNLEGELRTKDNASQVSRWSLSLIPSFRFNKHLEVGGGYEYIYFYDSKYADFQPRNRFILFVQGKQNLGNFTLTLRERAQVTFKDESDRIKSSGKIDTYKINPEWIWRNRLKVAYNIPKFPINPAISFETFYQLNNPEGNNFCKLRYTLAFHYNLAKHHHFELYGLIDKQINVNNPVMNHVIGIGYTYSF